MNNSRREIFSDSFEKDCSYLQSDWAFKAGLLKNDDNE
jgi:hypothetical protein